MDKQTPIKPVTIDHHTLSRLVGAAWLATFAIGVAAALTIAQGIDINLSADVMAVASNMLGAELFLRANAYLAMLIFCIEVFIYIGLFHLLREYKPLLSQWSLLLGLGASIVALMGAVYTMNAAQIAGNAAYLELANADQRLLLTGLQATADYTSFHLSLVLASIAHAGFFYAFLRSNGLPTLLAGWGLFANLFVASTIVLRDFIPALGSDSITIAFMLSNVIAILGTGVYLSVWGIKTSRVKAS